MTQVTDVKPLLTVATYLDDASGFEVYQEITGALPQALFCSTISSQSLFLSPFYDMAHA